MDQIRNTVPSLPGASCGEYAERDFALFFDMSVDMLCIAGFDGYFKRLNPAWERTLGWSIEDLLSRPWLDFVHPEDVNSTVAAGDYLMSGRILFTFENRYRCKDGSYRWISWSSFPVAERELIYAVARDVTDRRRAETELARLNEDLHRTVANLELVNHELEAFSYAVSHDLRAPLRAIDGFSAALAEDCGNLLDEAGLGYLARVREAAQRMGRLIDDLLGLSRVSRKAMRRLEVDMSRLAEDIVEELRAGEPGRSVMIEIAPGLRAEGDPDLLRIALQNLLGNAWKFTGKAPEARIAFRAEFGEGPPVFCVSDNGAGFDMSYSNKLFTPFQRLHRKDEFEGTGIGLATVQRVIRRHGGQIWAESAEGRGAAFYFTLG